LHIVERIAGLHHSSPQAEDAWQRILAFFDQHLR
jgi:carboxymethylenebutenolidase